MLAMGIPSRNVEVNRQWTEINRERRTELAPPMIFCVFSDTVTQKMGGGESLFKVTEETCFYRILCN